MEEPRGNAAKTISLVMVITLLGKVLGLTLAATAAGFLCRLALEYGEVTIAYAFSLPNCAFHLAAAAGLTLLGSCAARRLGDW